MQELFKFLKQTKGLKVLQEKINKVSSEDILFVQSENQENYIIKWFNLQLDIDQSKICGQKLNKAQSFAKMIQECNHENIPKQIGSFQIQKYYLIQLEAFDTCLYNWSQSLDNFYYIKNEIFMKF
ncbi:hypothetical protein ABPG72_021023 [Tetrahymena utriculariae]